MEFFFQAEDGIRDGRVTGVQTCALPIFSFDRFRGRTDRSTSPAKVDAALARLCASVTHIRLGTAWDGPPGVIRTRDLPVERLRRSFSPTDPVLPMEL